MSNNPDDYAFKQARRGGKTMLPIIQLIHEEDKRELISEFVSDLLMFQQCELGPEAYFMFEETKKKWEAKLK